MTAAALRLKFVTPAVPERPLEITLGAVTSYMLQGLTFAEIGSLYGVAESTIWRKAKLHPHYKELRERHDIAKKSLQAQTEIKYWTPAAELYRRKVPISQIHRRVSTYATDYPDPAVFETHLTAMLQKHGTLTITHGEDMQSTSSHVASIVDILTTNFWLRPDQAAGLRQYGGGPEVSLNEAVKGILANPECLDADLGVTKPMPARNILRICIENMYRSLGFRAHLVLLKLEMPANPVSDDAAIRYQQNWYVDARPSPFRGFKFEDLMVSALSPTQLSRYHELVRALTDSNERLTFLASESLVLRDVERSAAGILAVKPLRDLLQERASAPVLNPQLVESANAKAGLLLALTPPGVSLVNTARVLQC